MSSQGTNELTMEDIEIIKQLQNAFHVASELMADQVACENVGIFIGATKSGKSSLINYLLDNSLVGVQGNRMISIKKADNSNGPLIGHGFRSETIIPTKWENPERLPGLAIWDAPGFNDNRGKVQDITNAFYLYELFKMVKFVKIVLVVDIQHVMCEPINTFLSLLKSVENLLQDRMKDCFSSIAAIFTKVDEKIEINENLLSDLLEPIWTNYSLEMSQASRNFIRYLSEHPENVGFFKQANEGPVTDAIEVGVTTAIQRVNSVPISLLKNVLSPSIADTSKLFLCKCRDEISSVTEFNDLQMIICEVLQEILREFSQLYVANESRNQLFKMQDKLKELENQIDHVLTLRNGLCEKLNTLKYIHPKIERAISSDQLVEKSNLMEFMDNLLDLKESNHFDFNLQSIMVTARSKVAEIIVHIKLQLNEIDKKEAERKIEEIKERCQKESVLLKTELEELRSQNKAKGIVKSIMNGVLDVLENRFLHYMPSIRY